MSKSGSRYGRRSNWFKIHCLLQEQQQQQQQHQQQQQQQQSLGSPNLKQSQKTPPMHQHHQTLGMGMLGTQPFPPPLLHLPRTKEELMLLGFDEYKHAASPSVSSPESHNSDSSVEISDVRRTLPLFPGLLPPTFLPPPGLLFPPGYPPFYSGLLQPTNNNNRLMRNHNPGAESFNKRIFLDAILQSQRTPTPEEPEPVVPQAESPIQDDPIDLSMKPSSDRGSSPSPSDRSGSTDRGAGSDADEESDCDSERALQRLKILRPTPLDLTTKV